MMFDWMLACFGLCISVSLCAAIITFTFACMEMTKTPDEIKKGLECCTELSGSMCPFCPYAENGYVSDTCREEMAADALALIQQLQAENAEKADRIQQFEETVSKKEKVAAEPSGKIGQLQVERNQLLEKIEMLEIISEE